ncbi:MAG: hypothetical protein IPJ65_00765 [Archangiaceae bacterium]|nr:hypothetical protein [Archangiaceae bacterium]
MRPAALILLAPLAACINANDGGTGPEPTGPTYHHDVQPLIAQHCQGCHTAGGIAPFALDTFAQAETQAFAMRAAVTSRQMPPWMPEEEGCVPLRESRRLTDAQVKVFSDWAEGGAVEGAPAPPMPAKQERGLERVDASLKLPTPYTPQAGLTDDYRCFVLPHGQTVDRDVIGMNVRPDQRQMVHHVLVYAVDAALAKSQDDAEAGEGWTCFSGPGQDAVMLGGWVPGTSATQYPTGTGITLDAKKSVVVQIHYNLLTTGAQPDQTSLELQFSEARVPNPAAFSAMANFWFDIPPMAMGYSVNAQVKAPSSGTVWGVFPHMHTKGRKISVKKSGQCLIDVQKWDFHWQQSFFFASESGLKFNAGEQIDLSCTWDNATSNDVKWGEKTSDEMCLAYFYVTK